MELDFASVLRVGEASDLLEQQRGNADALVQIPSSGAPRGLAIKSLTVTGAWDRLWNMLRRRQQIYFLSIAFDVSEHPPTVLPPAEVPEGAVFKTRHGETVVFTLGGGAPVFLPRPITGGLVTYITVCGSDQGIRHIGEVMEKVHDDLSADDSIGKLIKGLISNPSKTVADELLIAATAALQPVATILKSNGDDYQALFAGVFSARGPWDDQLSAIQNGARIELRELREGL